MRQKCVKLKADSGDVNWKWTDLSVVAALEFELLEEFALFSRLWAT